MKRQVLVNPDVVIHKGDVKSVCSHNQNVVTMFDVWGWGHEKKYYFVYRARRSSSGVMPRPTAGLLGGSVALAVTTIHELPAPVTNQSS